MGFWRSNRRRTTEIIHTKLPLIGYACLNFENKMDVLEQGISRFRLKKFDGNSSNRWINIELLIDIRVTETVSTVPCRRFPWSFESQESSFSFHESSEDTKQISEELLKSQKHCLKGDYLTVYTRGKAYPTWKRYWVIAKEDQLILYDFTYKDSKEPLGVIPLTYLLSVNKPSLDDCENTGIARTTGFVLQFSKSNPLVFKTVRLDQEEELEGKIFIYGDNELNTNYWRKALVSLQDSNETVHGNRIEALMDLRYLW
ncbi:uncharacterized protein BX663DRAFT_512679 [Cokeromyces recurvatus]|uniref:uncharacterized protein n=1 Tax=Cokeromyces recurvatus TaxID=90255 RepID=UPI00221F348B|nr:uncharacterized protein BX663DRAFT_512679 [Cokeromyces recurvatus]KAI7901873.1 hypothetical protein BX663DRAFT_512679 [Cokeromyces recurvatus]